MSKSIIIKRLTDFKESRHHKIENFYSELKYILDSYVGGLMTQHTKSDIDQKIIILLRSNGIEYNIITIFDDDGFYIFSECFGGEFFIRDFMSYYELTK